MSQQEAHKRARRESDDWRTAAGVLSDEDNYYRLLDVPMTASRREITRAYRLIMMKWHPDRVRPEQKTHAEDLAKWLNLAYSTLADPVRRQQYDQSIRNEALQAQIMGRYVGGFATGGMASAAGAPRRPMTERERREQRESDRRANIAILTFFAVIAIAIIVVLVIASFVSFAGSALF
jgi:DnaJ-class molecular chaperone